MQRKNQLKISFKKAILMSTVAAVFPCIVGVCVKWSPTIRCDALLHITVAAAKFLWPSLFEYYHILHSISMFFCVFVEFDL